MGIKNKFNLFIEKLSEKSFKMNAIIFAVLWVVYVATSYFATFFIGFGAGDIDSDSMFLFITLCCQFFYIIFGVAVLVKLIMYSVRTKGLPITFYPNIFTKLVLLPQIAGFLLCVFIGVLAHFVDFLADATLPPIVAILAAIVVIVMLVFTVAIPLFLSVISVVGAAIFSKKIFNSSIDRPIVLSKKILNWILFWMIFIPCFIAVIFPMMLVESSHNLVGGYSNAILCGNEGETGICGWMVRQCWAKIDGFTRDGCYFLEAVEKRDQSICEKKIVDERERDLCSFGIAFDEAVERGDIAICDDKVKDAGKRDVCYNAVARTKRDWPICDKITTQTTKCSCYKNWAIAEKNPILCEQCRESNGWASNYANCYYSIADAKQDTSICGMVQTPVDKCFCYARIAEDLKDPSLCEQCNCGQECAHFQADCYEGVAEAKKDPSVCRLIPDQSEWDDCYENVAEWAHNPSACDLITDQKIKDTCYRKVRRR